MGSTPFWLFLSTGAGREGFILTTSLWILVSLFHFHHLNHVAECIVAKAIRDGGIDAIIDHEGGFMASKEVCGCVLY